MTDRFAFNKNSPGPKLLWNRSAAPLDSEAMYLGSPILHFVKKLWQPNNQIVIRQTLKNDAVFVSALKYYCFLELFFPSKKIFFFLIFEGCFPLVQMVFKWACCAWGLEEEVLFLFKV